MIIGISGQSNVKYIDSSIWFFPHYRKPQVFLFMKLVMNYFILR